MYQNLSSLLFKTALALTPPSIHRSSQNIVPCTRLAQLCTTTSKSVRVRSELSENAEQATDNEIDNRPGHKASAKDLLDDAATFIDQVPVNEESKWSTSPYPKGSIPRSQAHHSLRPYINPMETSLILFPGEGSQFVGMAKDLLKFPICIDLFKVANEILRFDLMKLCLQGPKAELDKPSNAQVAVLVSSLAGLERLKEERPSAVENCISTAGFSVGELTALVFAGVLSFERGNYTNILYYHKILLIAFV